MIRKSVQLPFSGYMTKVTEALWSKFEDCVTVLLFISV